MAKPTTTVHMNLVLAAEVQAGRVSPTTPIGVIRHANGTFETLFASFDRDSGAPSINEENGRSKFNGRPQ